MTLTSSSTKPCKQDRRCSFSSLLSTKLLCKVKKTNCCFCKNALVDNKWNFPTKFNIEDDLIQKQQYHARKSTTGYNDFGTRDRPNSETAIPCWKSTTGYNDFGRKSAMGEQRWTKFELNCDYHRYYRITSRLHLRYYVMCKHLIHAHIYNW